MQTTSRSPQASLDTCRHLRSPSSHRLLHTRATHRIPQQRRSLNVRAEDLPPPPVPKLPKKATIPPMEPELTTSKFGFVENAEVINSRAAMIGFFGILLVEWIAGKGIFEMVGLNVGNGLGFEF
ncbi:hypothetical protein CVIRNUC_010770 [Coccomyxa viridis]|uniref:High light inducible protein n=1 Tax=Coccomyxa viridis TaxID=1274662 RepID=A0AAV1ING7_9CHLO|nr:hypothetical protein CVIRNUC_010770 [Coccomyxa viridis]